MSTRSRAAGLCALVIVTTVGFASAADAASRKDQRYADPPRYAGQSSSFDGRVTGRPRTCGYETFVYDSRGGTIGPYCH
jgi:hypothetical protein